jgi:hypothetical protein
MASISSLVSLLLRHIGLLDGKTVHTTGDEAIAGVKNFSGTLQAGGHPIEAVVESGNGYIRYASGVQMCWGRVKVNGPITETKTKVTFPVAFKLIPAVLTTGNANYLGYAVMVGWETAASFTIGTSGDSSAVGETNWFAIGYWK